MEIEFIRWLRSRTPSFAGVNVGIGDDAAVLAPKGDGRIVVTTDMLMEGIDFENPTANAHRVGRKSLAVNLSDLAAMAARPLAVFVALAVPRNGGRLLAEQLSAGMIELAAEFQVEIAGGDTNSWDDPLVVCVTAIGEVTAKGPLLRSGARPGDDILVTGEFGGSILGRHFDFTPRVREALWAHEHFSLHAGIDVSDGLTLDLARLAEASGCGAIIDLSCVPVSADAQRLALLRNDGTSALEHALSDGEDFELILATSPDESVKILSSTTIRPVSITRIGHFIDRPGLWQLAADGTERPLLPRGYEHHLS